MTPVALLVGKQRRQDMKNQVVSIMQRAKRGFLRNDRGTMGIIAGLSMVGICLAIGAGIDFGRVTSAHSRLASALDVAALHVASMTDKTDAVLTPIAQDVMLKNYGGNTYDVVSGFSLVTKPDGKTLAVSAKVTVKTWFMSLGGISTVEALVKTEAIKGSGGNSIEVALILDNTGSMSADIGALRDAANSFVDLVIQDEQLPYFSRASVIPYAEGVNPGTAFLANTREAASSSCNWYTCPTYRYWSPSNSNYWTNNRTNCVTERTGAGAMSDGSFSSSKAAMHYEVCVAATIQPLTNDKGKLHAAINAMTANGYTAGHIGIAWGWYTLSPNAGVYTDFQPVGYKTEKVKKIAVIMTDGEFNTQFYNGVYDKATGHSGRENSNNPNGTANNQAIAMCNTMKASDKDIELYFVGFDLVSNTAVNSLKTACSTDAAHIIDAANQAELKAAFAKIAANLSSMRLSM
jgi:Flp pilus assembly protein TadG